MNHVIEIRTLTLKPGTRDDWRLGPRESILALIESYVDAVIEVDEITANDLRKAL